MESEANNDDGRWVFLKNGRLYYVDSEDDLRQLPLRVISERQWERLKYLEESYRKVSI
jgi:hypothetical protein